MDDVGTAEKILGNCQTGAFAGESCQRQQNQRDERA